MTEEKIPPLPELAIDGMPGSDLKQEDIDKILQEIYERRPDLFVRMAERDRTGIGSSEDEFVKDFDKFVSHDLKIQHPNMRVHHIYWEVRRRARLMYRMPI